MPPTSRPFLASPSAPSDVFTIHTIDSRSHLTTSNHHRRDGRPPRPLLGDAIATTSQPIDQQPDGQPRRLSVILPASSSSPSSSPPSGGEGRAESQPGRAIPSRSSCRPSPPCRGAVRIRLLSSSYHLRIRAIAGRRRHFSKRGKALKYFFSAYQIIN